jgi:hypothetical protein
MYGTGTERTSGKNLSNYDLMSGEELACFQYMMSRTGDCGCVVMISSRGRT